MSQIKIVGKKEVEKSFYGQLILGKGVSSSLDEQLLKAATKAGFNLKQITHSWFCGSPLTWKEGTSYTIFLGLQLHSKLRFNYFNENVKWGFSLLDVSKDLLKSENFGITVNAWFTLNCGWANNFYVIELYESKHSSPSQNWYSFVQFFQIIAFKEKQRIAEEVASILKLSVDISTAQSEGLFFCLI